MYRAKYLAFALIALLFVPAGASARLGGAQLSVPPAHKQEVSFHHFHKFKKFHHIKKPPTPGVTHHNTQWGYYVAGSMICSVAWPMLNAAMGNPEPTSEQMVQHVLGCWVPPLGVLFFLQQQGAL